ncbi:MAG: hypothetical protein M1832_005147 [Thelocarpon impressellum]|nr:MAG: hypothetical protein M1832_005147 [Thelocarpon impressellum]
MRPSLHHHVLPPVFLAIHVVIAIPALLPVARPAPDDAPAAAAPTLWQRLHPAFAVPVGVLAFAVIHAVRLLASRSPLPQHRRRRRLAARLERALLFLLGVVEEVWRWLLVRLIVQLEGGKGGYAGSMNGLSNGGDASRPLLLSSGPSREEIWGGVYLMCWTWSFVESIYAWKSIWPPPPDAPGRPPLAGRTGSDRRSVADGATPRPRSMGYGSFRAAAAKLDGHADSEAEPSGSPRPANRGSGSSRSSAGRTPTSFADLFSNRREPGSPRAAPILADQDRPVISDNSSDGDDEDSDADGSPVLSSRASLSEAEAGDGHEERPLLGGPAAPAAFRQHPILAPRSPAGDSPRSSPRNPSSPALPSPRLLEAAPGRATLRRTSSYGATASIFTLPLNTLHPLFPIIWRLTSLLTHLGYGLLYAWFPTLLLPVHHRLRIEWWSVGLLLLVSAVKGASTVLWFGGTVARWGVGRITALGLGAGMVTWLVAMGVWGIISIPWDRSD